MRFYIYYNLEGVHHLKRRENELKWKANFPNKGREPKTLTHFFIFFLCWKALVFIYTQWLNSSFNWQLVMHWMETYVALVRWVIWAFRKLTHHYINLFLYYWFTLEETNIIFKSSSFKFQQSEVITNRRPILYYFHQHPNG